MKRLMSIIVIAVLVVIIALEALPYGAVLNFAVAPDSGGGYIRETFSYFSLTPFGYASFGPLLTAVISVVLLVLFIIWIFANKAGLITASFVCCVIAFATSLMPVLYGVGYLSVIGIIISLLFAVDLIIIWNLRKLHNKGTDQK